MTQPQNESDWVTVVQAAKLLGCSKRTIWRRISPTYSEPDRLHSTQQLCKGRRLTLIQLSAPATAASATVAFKEHMTQTDKTTTALESTTAIALQLAQDQVQQAKRLVRQLFYGGTLATVATLCLGVTAVFYYGTSQTQSAVATELRARVDGIEQDKQRLLGQVDTLQTQLDQAHDERANATVEALIEVLGGTHTAHPDMGG